MRNAGWFRFYDRMIDSPQILELSDTEFRLIVSLWCLTSAQEQRGRLPFTARAIQRRVLPTQSVEDVDAMLAHFIELELLGSDEKGYYIQRWDDHQYQHQSWTPEARREQKQRERNQKNTRRDNVATMSQGNDEDVATSRKTEEEGDPDPEKDPPEKKNKRSTEKHTQEIDPPTHMRACSDVSSSSPTPSLAQQVQDAAGIYSSVIVTYINRVAPTAAAVGLDLVEQAGEYRDKYLRKHQELNATGLRKWIDNEIRDARAKLATKTKLKRLQSPRITPREISPPNDIPPINATGPPTRYHRLKAG